MSVNFMIIGAQKCGTTSLFETLDRHPSLAGCSVKETHFFSTDPDWRKGLERYESLFPPGSGVLRFEASTSYTFSPHRNPAIWEDLRAYNPDLKLIYLVRRPLDRIISAYMHNVQRGFTDRPLDEEVLRNPLYLDVSRYASQIRPYIDAFGPDRVLLLEFEDLVARREEVLGRISSFLCIDQGAFENVAPVHANRSVGKSQKDHHRFDHPALHLRLLRRFAPPVYDALRRRSRRTFRRRPELLPGTRTAVLEMLELEIRGMEELMERDLEHWREGRERPG